MNERTYLLSGWFGLAALALGAIAYLWGLDSKHAATNPDELLYLQITRVTAATGNWLPLQSTYTKHRNTKPPALFWQGIASSDWGRNWDLWRLRWPSAAYSLAVAVMVFLLARKLAGRAAGIAATLAYLAFFGVFRHGRVLLTSAPETFWIFLPFFVLLMWRPKEGGLSWLLAFAFGLSVGAGLLYKSFALAIPFSVALGWWTLHGRGYRVGSWLLRDMPKVLLAAIVALGVFSLWYWLDPQRELILQDFILKENVGKFDSGDESYLLNLVAGKHSIWQYTAGWLTNAGLLAPAVLAVFVLCFRGRREATDEEKLLWIWIAVTYLAFIPSNLRYERYLLMAVPALAVLCGLHWHRIPLWVLNITLLACAGLAAALAAGGYLLTATLNAGAVYPSFFWILAAGTFMFALAGAFQSHRTHAFTLPAVLLVYLTYAGFLSPFDGPRGEYSAEAIAASRGRTVALPTVYNAREELYRFLLPGAEVKQVRSKPMPVLEQLLPQYGAVIWNMPLGKVELGPGVHVLGSRLNLEEYFTSRQIIDMLRGHVAENLFSQDVLVEAAR